MSNPSEDWVAQLKVVEKNSDGTTKTRVIRRTVTDFKFEGELGEGSYSTVLLARDIHTDKFYAIKKLDKRHIVKEKKVKYVGIEKDTLNKLGRRNGIVHLFFTFQDEYSLYYVLDYASNGELLSLIKKYGSLNEAVTKYYTCQIMDALKYIHDSGIIHRDLKPENILLDENFAIQITDFGTAKVMPKDPITNKYIDDGKAKSFVGTAEYVSPELLNDKAVGKPCDIWALGCIVFQMIAGRPPFKATNDYLTFQQVMKVKYAFSAGFPTIVRDLVKRILVPIPEDRPTIKDLEKHLYFQDVDWKNPDESIWYSPPPEFGPYKMSSQSMKLIPELLDSPQPKMRIPIKSKTSKSSSSASSFTNKSKTLEAQKTRTHITSAKDISANAALIALTKLSVTDRSVNEIKPRRKSKDLHHSTNHRREISVPAVSKPGKGKVLRMKYHDDVSTPPVINSKSPKLTSDNWETKIGGGKPKEIYNESNNNQSDKKSNNTNLNNLSISLPNTPLVSSASSVFGNSRPQTPKSATEQSKELKKPLQYAAAQTHIQAQLSKTSQPQPTQRRKSRVQLSSLDNQWIKFLHKDEKVAKVGVLFIHYMPTEAFEKKFRGKIANTPLYYKGKRINGAGDGIGGTGNGSLLTQMAFEYGRSNFRGDSSSTVNKSNDDSEVSSTTDADETTIKNRNLLTTNGIVHYVKTQEIEELENELDPHHNHHHHHHHRSGSNSSTSGKNHYQGAGVFKKFLRSTKSAMNSGISTMVPSAATHIEFRSNRMILITNRGRLLILGKKPMYANYKNQESNEEDVYQKYQEISEIDLTNTSIKFKEIIIDTGNLKTGNLIQDPSAAPSHTPGSEIINDSARSQGDGNKLPFYYGFFAVETSSTTVLFQTDKTHLNNWTEHLFESRYMI